MKGSDGQGSVRNRTTMLAFFGQVRSSWTRVPILSETVFKRHCHCRTAPHSIMCTPGGDLRDPDGERDAVMSDRGHQDPHIKVATARGLHVTCHVSRVATLRRCDDNYDKECKGESTMPFYRAQYDTATGQSPNLPREQVPVIADNEVS